MSTRNLKTVSQFSEIHSAFTEGALRWDIFQSKNNGLDKKGALVRRGRRVYIDEDRYFEWLEEKQA